MVRQMSLSEQITYSTVLIKCLYQDGKEGSGTGFIFHLCDDGKNCVPVIVTNNHVVKNSIKTTFEFCSKREDGNPDDQNGLLIDIQGNGWIKHPNNKIDLCCLPIAPILNVNCPFYIPLRKYLIPTDQQINSLRATEDVVMVGYPSGISDMYNHKPIIRKGITATHIKNNYQGNPTFLVDMACFPGSSGSPIFILNEGICLNENRYPCIGDKLLFIGVLFQGPQYTAAGQLFFSEIPNCPIPCTNIPMNLGEAIKAAEVLEFEKIFLRDINQNIKNNGIKI